MHNFDANPFQLNIWLQSYKEFVDAKNNIKQRNLKTVFAYISKTISPTSDLFLLIMSHFMNVLKICNGEIMFLISIFLLKWSLLLHIIIHPCHSTYWFCIL